MNLVQPTNGCAYCGLPLDSAGPAEADGPISESGEARQSVRYCCHGCRFAATITQSRGEVAQARGLMIRLGLALFFSMNVMAFTMFLWTQEDGAQQRAAAVFYDIGRYVCLLFTTPVLLLLAGPLVEDAWAELQRRRPSLSGLLIIGVLAAFTYSVVSVLRGAGHVYFEVTCMVLVAVTLGRWLEAQGKLQTTAALRSLQKLLPDEVRRVGATGEVLVPRTEIVAGDTIRVLAGERIAVDGLVARGEAAIDQQAVTGESVPVVKQVGDPVFSGTLNLDGDLTLAVTAPSAEGTLQRIIAAVTQAVTRNDRYQRLADRVSAWFLPAILLIALATLGAHWVRSGFADALLASLSVIVIACPCALGLATPMALWAAVGNAARHQVLLREADCLDRLANATLFCFDKTGTLTTGVPRLERIVAARGESVERLLSVAASLASGSTHPLSIALADEARRRDCFLAPVNNPRTLAGRGLVGELVQDHRDTPTLQVVMGSERFLRESLGAGVNAERWSEVFPPNEANGPVVGVAWDGHLRGSLRFMETLRAGAADCTRWLAASGRAVQVLTGDNSARAARLAEQLGVAVLGDQLPDDKLAWVESRRRRERVVMVGDGINDAPALAAADVGIALGCGTDIARHTAGICLLGNDLTRISWLVDLAQRTVSTIRWNLFWAFAYNTVGIAVAAAGWLNPIVAALAMAVSSLLVVSNSLRLARDVSAEESEAAEDTRLGEPLVNRESESRESGARESATNPGGVETNVKRLSRACVESGVGG